MEKYIWETEETGFHQIKRSFSEMPFLATARTAMSSSVVCRGGGRWSLGFHLDTLISEKAV